MNVEILREDNYESSYEESITDNSGNYDITTETKNINGTEVRFVNATDDRNNDNFQDYFFAKNGKYYVVRIFDHARSKTTWAEDIQNAVTTVISTMN
jgi:tRNA A37 threonylcarbamoyladenosine dehydratase